MKTITRPDSRAPAFAFALLSLLLMCSNAAPAGETESRGLIIGHPQAATVMEANSVVSAGAEPANVSGVAGNALVGHTPKAIFNTNQVNLSSLVNSVVSQNNMVWHPSLGALIALIVLLIVAVGGWCRTRVALNLARRTLVGVESEWQRRYAAVEAREQVAHVSAAASAEAVAVLERDRIHSAMRHFVSAPLSALAGLLETLHSTILPPAERSLAGKIHSGMRTTLRVLEDMLLPSTGESHAILLDENSIDVRELIEGVVALFAPAAEANGLFLSVSIDKSVASRVLADSDRLGQIVFHMLSRALRYSTRGVVTIVARANPLNTGSQQISISVRHVVSEASDQESSSQERSPQLRSTGAREDEVHDDGEPGLSLCRKLAQYMRGEFTVESEKDVGLRSTFSAPFAIEEQMHPTITPASAQGPVSGLTVVPQQVATSVEPSSEPFDRAYLNALSNEGIELHAFMGGWRQSMRDDLQRMRSLREQHDIGGLRGVLHRLSGAVGLVGARDLTEALRRVSTAQREPEARVLDVLEKRSESLMKQLDETIGLYRSDLP
jgi:signal transduction histidine kinase